MLTYDKEEIISLGRRIGTYELSLEEYKDCCAIITRHPKTRVKSDVINEYVERLSLKGLVLRSLEAGSLVSYNPVGSVLEAIHLESLDRAPPLTSVKADL